MCHCFIFGGLISQPSSTVPFDDSVFSPFGPARKETVFAFNVVSLSFLIDISIPVGKQKEIKAPVK